MKVHSVTDEWGAMLEDIIGLWAVGEPDKDDVLDVLAEHRGTVEHADMVLLSRALRDTFGWAAREADDRDWFMAATAVSRYIEAASISKTHDPSDPA